MAVEIFMATSTDGTQTFHYSRSSAVQHAGRFAEVVPYIVENAADLDAVTISDDYSTFTVSE